MVFRQKNGMLLAFIGDTSFHDLKKKSNFNELKNELKGSKVILNLESPITEENYPIKNKISIKQHPKTIKYLQKLRPYLVNIGNNHINDYGKKGVKDTKEIMKKQKINFLGAGKINSEHNIFIDETQKIAYFSYVSRETDHSLFLFEQKGIPGPRELSTKEFNMQSKKYSNYKKILLLHWGSEELVYPSKIQRVKSKELINAGADLIIGTHPHVIQGYEKYKNKYIFYSLGNFFFPDICNKTGKKKSKKRNRTSIIPFFDKNLQLKKILTVYQCENNTIKIKNNNRKVEILSNKLQSTNYQLILDYEFFKRAIIRYLAKIKSKLMM